MILADQSWAFPVNEREHGRAGMDIFSIKSNSLASGLLNHGYHWPLGEQPTTLQRRMGWLVWGAGGLPITNASCADERGSRVALHSQGVWALTLSEYHLLDPPVPLPFLICNFSPQLRHNGRQLEEDIEMTSEASTKGAIPPRAGPIYLRA